MAKATVLIDANNFYASCEKMIDPSLMGRPLVILSNNDGCIISRSSEARELNISMGVPYFKVRHKLKQLGVHVRSSNYSLYGDISRRLMAILSVHCEELETYSIDEAFVQLTRPQEYTLYSWARQLRTLIYKNLGIPIAIGIGTNKVHAKIANHLAKTVATHAGIFDLDIEKDKDNWLKSVPIEDVWGVGRQLTHWCKLQGIKNAKQLRDMPSNKLKAKVGIVGIRLQNELRGESCIKLISSPPQRKEMCVSKSFKQVITNKEELQQAIACHIVQAGKKLRKQKQRARKISVFTRTSSYTATFYSQVATETLNTSSNDTNVLLKAALALTEQIYRPHIPLRKAGVLMQGLQSMDYQQQNLLESKDIEKQLKNERLMETIDKLNNLYGDKAMTWCVCGTRKGWDMRREKLSPASTTVYEEIPIVKI
tara:strand:+ start:1955 stop:3229 length:1275 start_codon:yes stop_codon:yes gene_type:complete